jgi:hypothetical protein
MVKIRHQGRGEDEVVRLGCGIWDRAEVETLALEGRVTTIYCKRRKERMGLMYYAFACLGLEAPDDVSF